MTPDATATRRPLRVAVVADYPEEGWASMDLTAEMIVDHLGRGHAGEVEAVRVCPAFRRRLGRLPFRPGLGRNVDRLANRHLDYPRYLRRLAARERFDVYHVIDQSYAQLIGALPRGRSVLTCHDLDTFRCLFRPDLEPRPAWFRAIARRILRGFAGAAAVACVSEATRDVVRTRGLVSGDRLHVIPNGIHPEYLARPGHAAEAESDRLLGPPDPAAGPILLHVGSTIPRKRIDLLLDIFAAIRRGAPGARLIKVGGGFTPTQARQLADLGLDRAVHHVGFVDGRPTLAALYRRAALVLQPSESEGFGLPLAEAMACGVPLLVSDLPVFREVAGDAAVYRPVGDVQGWAEAALGMLDPADAVATRTRREVGLARSTRFRWDEHVASLVSLYREIASAPETA